MSNIHYLGIDLGTSNSAVAVFDGENVKTILNPMGDINTPSVVQVTKTGVVVGVKAKRELYNDPENTFKEFKRLMGSDTRSRLDQNQHCWSPEELSSEILKSLKLHAEQQSQRVFDKVVITVPALFEIPQNKATADAARLAGFQKVELLPEPVASGLAAGWNESEAGTAWLVFDLGGGTFDASLLETRDGLLRIVAHDGDNFLGGRDIDRSIVTWMIDQLANEHGITLPANGDEHQAVMRHFEAAAEEAKIRLSNVTQTIIEIDTIHTDHRIQIDIPITREQLKSLCGPIIQRAVSICRRLIEQQGLDQEKLARVVLVGGPAHMPMIQEIIAEQLAPVATDTGDPMSLVARGAALYAAITGLGCEESKDTVEATQRHQVWLQYPAVCTELNPTILGRVIDDTFSARHVKLVNTTSAWESAPVEIDSDGVFIIEASIKPSQKNSFKIVGINGPHTVDLSHQGISISHGIGISAPPLSRSIGVALADGTVKTFIERGTPLPAKRTFIQSTVETLVPKTDQKLVIPVVQGERRQSRFCRDVGSMIIDAKDLKETLRLGSSVEITIEVDRGGNLTARAFLPEQNTIIDGVAKLVMGSASPDALKMTIENLQQRIFDRLRDAFREREEALVSALTPLSSQLQQIQADIPEFENSPDTCQKALRNLMDLEAELDHIESREQLSELIQECEEQWFRTSHYVREYGDEVDKKSLESCSRQVQQAINSGRQAELERLVERMETICHSAHQKSPFFWKDVFLHWASFVHAARDPKRARKLVEDGYAAIERDEIYKLKNLTQELYNLIPSQYRGDGRGNHESGIY